MTEPKLNKIISWTKNYAQENNIRTLIVPFSGGYNSTLTSIIAKKTNIHSIAVLCEKSNLHNSEEQKKTNLLREELLTSISIPLNKVNPEIGISFAEAFLWSFQLANIKNGIVLGTINKNKLLTRHYKKHIDGSADIFPILGLFEGEVRELVSQFTDIKPIDDIEKHELFLDLRYEEIKWATNENDKYNIIAREDKPQNFEKWYKYTKRQKEVISNIYQRHKLTKHKDITHKPHII